ncbi:hypothetical protein PV326_002097, partial [Microctonus aethiopoides]
ESTTYVLYEVIPLPIPHNSSQSLYIEFISPYLIIDPSKTYYSQLQSLEDCSLTSPRNYICHGIILYRVHEKPSCETTAFITIKEAIPSICQTRTTKLQTEFWHSVAENKWLFVTTNPLYVTLSCGTSTIDDIEINNIGILQLNQNCKLYSDAVILESSNKIYQNVSKENVPLHIDDDCCNEEKMNTELSSIELKPVNIVNVKIEDLKIASHALKRLEKTIKEESNEFVTTTTTNVNWSSTILSSILITSILFFSWKLIRRFELIQIIRRFFCHKAKEEIDSKNLCLK